MNTCNNLRHINYVFIEQINISLISLDDLIETIHTEPKTQEFEPAFVCTVRTRSFMSLKVNNEHFSPLCPSVTGSAQMPSLSIW